MATINTPAAGVSPYPAAAAAPTVLRAAADGTTVSTSTAAATVSELAAANANTLVVVTGPAALNSLIATSRSGVFEGANVTINLEEQNFSTTNQVTSTTNYADGANGSIQYNNGADGFASDAFFTYTSGNVVTPGIRTNGYFYGNGAPFIGGGNAAIGNFVFSGDTMTISDANQVMSITGNGTGNIRVTSNGNIWTFDNAGNLTLPSNTSSINYANGVPYGVNYSNSNVSSFMAAFGSNVVSTTGNITAGYFVGNGSQLTGVVSSYGNANVVANLAALGSNPVSTTGNITAGNISANNLVINSIRSDDSTFVTIEDGLNVTSGAISSPESMLLTAGANTWLFGTDSVLTLAGGATLKEGVALGALALGYQAGQTSQGIRTVAIGEGTGQTSQGARATAVGAYAGGTSQGGYAVAVGWQAGEISQGGTAVAIGNNAGQTTQGINATAIGASAGFLTQGNSAVAIGYTAGANAQGQYAVAVGNSAGLNNQGTYAVAVGQGAGYQGQGEKAVAIGLYAGNTTQGNSSVAIGDNAGYDTQGESSVAVGRIAGQISQGSSATAVGYGAGYENQGLVAVAIGALAGVTNQGNNSIIINATGSALDQTVADTFTVAPVRNDVANIAEVMFYNATSKEITYGNTISVTGNITGNYFIGNGSQLTSVAVPSQTILPTIQSITAVARSAGLFGGGEGGANVTVANTIPVTEYGVIITAGTISETYKTGALGSIPGTVSLTFTTGLDSTQYTLFAYVTSNAGTYYSNAVTGTSGICLLAGTQIALSDGTHKAIEHITYTDKLLSWDFDRGCYAETTAVWIKRSETGSQYNLLTFSDGTTLRTFDQHRIFNKQAGAFTYPMTAATPVGTVTVNEHGQEITLTNKQVIRDTIEYYNVITDYHMNLFSDSVLTSCRFNNIYPIVDMKFAKDGRTPRTRAEFENVPDRFFHGLRLAEQTADIETVEWYVNRLLSTEVSTQAELAV